MYLGQIVEKASREQLFDDPKHPYTEALLSASPAIDTDELIELHGDVPEPDDPPTGCRFHTRCQKAFEDCGWSGRDLYHLIKRHQDTDETVTEMWTSIEDAEFDGYDATFEFDRDADPFVPHLRGETDVLRTHQEPLFEAMTDVQYEGSTVTLSFKQITPPAPVEEEDGHEVACFLYE
jgi:oligopeptide/dipeptide ABC transporter ATP-binding protein